MSLLSIDVGTTSCKAAVFSVEGKLEAQAYREYPLIQPKPGWAELDPVLVWERVSECVREVSGKVCGIKAVSVSSQGEAAIPVDRHGNPLDNSIVTFDTRARETARLLDSIGNLSREEIFQLTGMPPSGMYTLPKLLWIRENKPDVFKNTWKFMCYEDYIFYKLGLPPVIDFSLAGKTMLFEVTAKRWSPDLLGFLGIDESKLGEPHPSGEVIGKVNRAVAKDLGLREDVIAVVGAHDQAAAALGAGVIRPGICMDSTGTTESIALISSRPILSEAMLKYNYPCYPYILPGFYITVAFNLVAGALLRWYRDILGGEEVAEAKSMGREVYDVMMERMSQEPSRLFVLPHFAFSGTPYCDPDSVGAMVGLTLSTTRGEIIKAIVEGVTFAMKQNLELLCELGFGIEEFRAVGGGARSRAWLQLKADMFRGRIVSLEVPDSPCLGVAILAGVAVEEYGSVEEAVTAMVRTGEEYWPDPKRAKAYDEGLTVFKRLYPAVKYILEGFDGLSVCSE